MDLHLYCHPFASYCQKVLSALYETGTPFSSTVVDLGDEKSRNDFFAIWPIGKFPVLADRTAGEMIPESSIIIEYLASKAKKGDMLLPREPGLALQVRLWDRFFDHYIHEPMQKIVTDRIRPSGQRDPYGVAQARKSLATAYGIVDRHMAGRLWAVNDRFTMADCAASPALYYAARVAPIPDSLPGMQAYHRRLLARPSFVRVLKEAEPYAHFFPKDDSE